MQRVLFLCSQNRLRSPTAEQVFASWPDVECTSAGLDSSALTPLDSDTVQWAQVIFVMERSHRTKLARKFKPWLNGKRVIVLGIPDEYAFMDPALIDLLTTKVGPYLRVR